MGHVTDSFVELGQRMQAPCDRPFEHVNPIRSRTEFLAASTHQFSDDDCWQWRRITSSAMCRPIARITIASPPRCSASSCLLVIRLQAMGVGESRRNGALGRSCVSYVWIAIAGVIAPKTAASAPFMERSERRRFACLSRLGGLTEPGDAEPRRAGYENERKTKPNTATTVRRAITKIATPASPGYCLLPCQAPRGRPSSPKDGRILSSPAVLCFRAVWPNRE